MSGPHWEIIDNNRILFVSFPTNPPVRLRLASDEVDVMIENLREMRDVMQPEHPLDPIAGPVKAAQDPRWFVEPDAMEGNPVLRM